MNEKHAGDQFPPEERPDIDPIAEIPLPMPELPPPHIDPTALDFPEKPKRNGSVPAGSKDIRIPITNPE